MQHDSVIVYMPKVCIFTTHAKSETSPQHYVHLSNCKECESLKFNQYLFCPVLFFTWLRYIHLYKALFFKALISKHNWQIRWGSDIAAHHHIKSYFSITNIFEVLENNFIMNWERHLRYPQCLLSNWHPSKCLGIELNIQSRGKISH